MAFNGTAVFFLSTGRCGTQWLAAGFQKAFPASTHVTHEPIKAAYLPKKYLRATDRLAELAAVPRVAHHMQEIEEAARQRIYIETGWPCYAAIPLMKASLNAHVKVVQLVRHPVPTALSLASHRLYARNDWMKDAAIDPFDEGVVQKDLAPVWSQLTMYEKCLFWWTEIHLFGEELRRRFAANDFFVLRYEDLFEVTHDAFPRLLEFLGLPATEELAGERTRSVDRFRQKMSPVDIMLIRKYPATQALARRFDYDVDAVSLDRLAERYFATRASRWTRTLKAGARRLVRASFGKRK